MSFLQHVNMDSSAYSTSEPSLLASKSGAEGALLLILMSAHMGSHEFMRARLLTILHRRVAMQGVLDRLGIMPQALKVQLD